MDKYYTDEKNVQILLALLKAHGVRKAILSPGSANSPLVASMQYDSYFECYSCVDERSAAYMACGLAAESGEPVVISCTGATASRNYLPGITEAYYRKLPVLAITSTQPVCRVGHLIAQVVDRSNQPNDTYGISVTLPIVDSPGDIMECELKVNDAILHLKRWNGGPAHINLQTNSLTSYTTKVLPDVRKISQHYPMEELPPMPTGRKAIFIGSHRRFSEDEIKKIEQFCETNNGVVFCDHTSQYHGKYRILAPLIGGQQQLNLESIRPALTIHIGEVSGDYYGMLLTGPDVWRVCPDGNLRDTFNKLTNVFCMPIAEFFGSYATGSDGVSEYYEKCNTISKKLHEHFPEVPFSNIWIASYLSRKLPKPCSLHFGILNSLRSWNFFELDEEVVTQSNVGGFGIDGILSTLLGASLHDPSKPYYVITGDLAFFYDMNALGNRHVGKNIRILLVNNGLGTEFKTYNHHTSHFGDAADQYISAAGHYGSKSPDLVRNYAENLGFRYLSAHDKESFVALVENFVNPGDLSCPLLFEVFTESDLECKALELVLNAYIDPSLKTQKAAKDMAKRILGEKGTMFAKKLIS